MNAQQSQATFRSLHLVHPIAVDRVDFACPIAEVLGSSRYLQLERFNDVAIYVHHPARANTPARMRTTQSTFQRILSSAYRKVGQAVVGGKALKIGDAVPHGRPTSAKVERPESI